MSDLIDRNDAIMAVKAGALSAATLYGRTDEGSTALYDTVRAIKAIPSAQPDNRLSKIADLVEGTIDHFDLDDAMDLLYQIKDVLEDELPSAQPQRMKGRWIRKESDLSWWYECSECGESPLFDPYENEVLTPFCPWCGAEMRGEEDV